ncbi:nuclear transport factor 2-like [Typha angustifolia]|uniref:nuclear transport factor 2-like n=1 Tax=Typha angustifolia TaxID=59011 RepID=UPI003C2E143D
MASENAVSAGSTPTSQVVGNAFVHQYYNILHQSPDLVYRFYQEDSKLSRPGPDGVLSSVTTMHAINEKILAMDYHEVKAEISTVASQESLGSGVLVLVTGCLTGSDNIKKHFTQSFFLAPQDKGYYVLNDIFRYVKEDEESRGLTNSSAVALSAEQEAPLVQEHQGMVLQPKEDVNDEEVYNPLENGEILVLDEEVPVEEVINEAPSNSQEVVANSCCAAVQEEAPKKSYASIVKVMKENTSSIVASALALIKPAPVKTEKVDPTPTPASTKESPDTNLNATESDSAEEIEADGHSIYVKNLPLNATPAQLGEEFKRFGPIKPLGVQVRSHKQQGFCFGFVKFEVASAVQSAIEASPVMIGGRQAYVEEKRPAGSRGKLIKKLSFNFYDLDMLISCFT